MIHEEKTIYRKIPDIYCRNVTNSSALVLTRTMHANIDK